MTWQAALSQTPKVCVVPQAHRIQSRCNKLFTFAGFSCNLWPHGPTSTWSVMASYIPGESHVWADQQTLVWWRFKSGVAPHHIMGSSFLPQFAPGPLIFAITPLHGHKGEQESLHPGFVSHQRDVFRRFDGSHRTMRQRSLKPNPTP